MLGRIGSLTVGNWRWSVGKRKKISVGIIISYLSGSARFWIAGVYATGVYALQRNRIHVLEPTIDGCLLGRGLLDDPFSLSNETRCRGGVSRSTALSDTLWGRAAREIDGGSDDKRVSDVEGSPEPPNAPLIRRLVAERPTGDDRRSVGRADSLSELVC